MIFCGRVVEGVSTVSVLAEVLAGSRVFSVESLSLSVRSSNFSSLSLTVGEEGGKNKSEECCLELNPAVHGKHHT